jgi:ABC-type Na+ transport system ATPase subunit NatA
MSISLPGGPHRGLIGPNGAGKTTAMRAILGLTPFEGELKVLGLNPYTERDRLMQDVCFIADVAVLPGWLRVHQALRFVAGVHPHFRPERAEEFLSRTTVKRTSRVRELSKGMITQLHLALVMAIDARLLVLDEPTIGLDIIYRKQFYETLLSDYFDQERTILITTHQVEEVENILTDCCSSIAVVVLDSGRGLPRPCSSANPARRRRARSSSPFTSASVRHAMLFQMPCGRSAARSARGVADLTPAKIEAATEYLPPRAPRFRSTEPSSSPRPSSCHPAIGAVQSGARWRVVKFTKRPINRST